MLAGRLTGMGHYYRLKLGLYLGKYLGGKNPNRLPSALLALYPLCIGLAGAEAFTRGRQPKGQRQ